MTQAVLSFLLVMCFKIEAQRSYHEVRSLRGGLRYKSVQATFLFLYLFLVFNLCLCYSSLLFSFPLYQKVILMLGHACSTNLLHMCSSIPFVNSNPLFLSHFCLHVVRTIILLLNPQLAFSWSSMLFFFTVIFSSERMIW